MSATAFSHGPLALPGGGFAFRVWAPRVTRMDLELEGRAPLAMDTASNGCRDGWWRLEVPDCRAGQRYRFLLEGETPRPDPASQLQEDGVHGWSTVVDHAAFAWTAAVSPPPPFDDWVVYELHVGTFTPEGTFDGVVNRLDHLAGLGANALEIMPVTAFPGCRNWGYDGVQPYAVQACYGGPEGFKRLVDAAHALGMAVILDVVYNHLGPEGNYLREFGPYFTDVHHTPWGEAVNYDQPGSDAVRGYVVENALHWFERYRVDGLRLDAVQTIHDERPTHILAELAEAVAAWGRAHGRRPVLMAESDRNDPADVTPRASGGKGMDAVWADDFHHGVHALLTGERQGFYQDYGTVGHVAEALAHGFAYRGAYSAYRGRGHGADPAKASAAIPARRFVFDLQNHDMVGNRARGERLCALAPHAACKSAAALLLLAPATPLLFMGEEWAATTPFLYFVDHGDQGLLQAVAKGRRREFRQFGWKGKTPDPGAPETFAASKLDWSEPRQPGHADMLAWYRTLIGLRRTSSCRSGFPGLTVWGLEEAGVVVMRRASTRTGEALLVVASLNPEPVSVDPGQLAGRAGWGKVLESLPEAARPLPETLAAPLDLPAYGCGVWRRGA